MIRLIASLLLASANALAAPLTLDAAGSRVAFSYQQMGMEAEGTFGRYSAEADFDAARPQAARLRFDVDLSSVDVGLADVSAELLKPEFFDVKRSQRARFVSTRVQPLVNGYYDVHGTLTLKGVTRPIVSRAQIKSDGSALRVQGSFSLQRLDYGIGSGQWRDESALGNTVTVQYSLRLLRAPAAVK